METFFTIQLQSQQETSKAVNVAIVVRGGVLFYIVS